MQLPLFLPKYLTILLKDSKDEWELLDKLKKNTTNFVAFFEFAADDETWSDQHGQFMRPALEWLTEQFFTQKLSQDSAEHITKAVYQHLSVLRAHIPFDITFEIDSKDISVNSLLFSANSTFFHELIRIECYNKTKRTLTWNEIPYDRFLLVAEFINSGTIDQLWKLEKDVIFALLHEATRFQTPGLTQFCEETLRRYVNSDNAIDTLIMAHLESWPILKQKCFEVLNQLSLGVKFEEVVKNHDPIERKELKPFTLEFLEFSDNSLGVFARLRHLITHLICSGSLTEEASFSYVMQACPHLISLDISRTRTFSDRLIDIPSTIEQLDISKCSWLVNATLKKMIGICPQLTKLSLNSNVQLTFVEWAELQKLRQLKALDISRCHQIHDDDFLLILKACTQVTELSLEECTRLTDRALFEIARNLKYLAILNIARCHLSDGLLAEITSHCCYLRRLNITRCLAITAKGLLQALKPALELRELNISHCRISDITLEAVREHHPLVKVII